MPFTTTTPGVIDDILATTFQKWADTIQDNVYNAIAHMHMMKSSGAIKFVDGGEAYLDQVLFGDNTTAKRLSGPYDTISVDPQSNITAAQYVPRMYAASVTIALAEELDNDGTNQIIRLLGAKSESAELALRNLWNTDMITDTTGVSGALLGLGEAISSAAVGSQTGTIGGINKATFTFWNNQYGNASSAFGSNGRQRMSTVYNSCSAGSADHPTMILTTQSGFENYERTLEAVVQMDTINRNPNAVGDPKFDMLKFRGALIYFDPACIANKMYMLNPRYYYLRIHRKANFNATQFTKFGNQLARTAQIYTRGQVCINNMRRLGLVDNVDTF